MKQIIFILLLISASAAYSQNNEFSIVGNYGTNRFNNSAFNLGVQYELALDERFSLLYSFKIGADENKQFIFDSPMGAYGGTYLFIFGLADENDDYYSLGVLAWFLPEGLAYNIPVSQNTVVSPYIKPLSFQHSAYYTKTYLEAGVRLKQYVSNSVFLGLDFGLSTTYTPGSTITYMGGNLGFVLDN